MIHEVVSMMNLYGTGRLAHDVAYEWAEEIAKYFGVPALLNTSFYAKKNPDVANPITYSYIRVRHFVGEIFPILRKIKGYAVRKLKYCTAPLPQQNLNAPLTLCILMEVPEMSAFINTNSLLVFTDVWDMNINYVIRYARRHNLFYVTSRYVFNRIKTICPSSRVLYMPLSVSDMYYSYNFEKYHGKNVDVVQFGRKDPLLHEYMLRYADEHKNIDYVYSSERRGSEYVSTLRGNVGCIESRDNFISVLSSAKISLVSSPGMYKDFDAHKYGCCFATPRFYESAVLGCALIGRYPDNEEFRELNMSRYCPNITSYEQFCEALEHALAQTPEELYAQNHDFIINSLTSKRAEQIQSDLEALTCTNS